MAFGGLKKKINLAFSSQFTFGLIMAMSSVFVFFIIKRDQGNIIFFRVLFLVSFAVALYLLALL